MKEFLTALKDLEKENSEENAINYLRGQKNRFIGNFKIMKKYLSEKDKILEVGSFPSYFLAALNRCGYNVSGLDLDPKREEGFLRREKIIVKKCDIEREKFPFSESSIDKVILSEVFEHLYVNPVLAMKEIKRILGEKGTLILTTPNGYSIKRIFNFLKGRGASENPFNEFNKINTVGHRGHIREYSVNELRDFLLKSGLKLERVYYVNFEHLGLEKKPVLSSIVNFIYWVFPKFRSHLILIVKK